jgi:hypothetical protein
MSITTIRIRRALLSLAVTAMVLATLPIPAAHALAPLDTPTPTAPGTFAGLRLETVWERQQIAHDRLGVMFDHIDWRLTHGQQLIDQAKANGKDVAAVQNALDSFGQAVQEARPIYEGMQGTIASHQGFDAKGNVTDVSQAAGTERDMAEKLKEIRGLLQDPGMALRDAVRAYREANQLP